jgi:hypothetical protein
LKNKPVFNEKPESEHRFRHSFLLVFLLTFQILVCNAQQKDEDVTMTLQEQALNKMFTALGPVFGSDTYTLLFVKGTYRWTLQNPHIELLPGKADYVADVEVETGPFLYKSTVTGDVSITYAADSNKIIIRITKAIFPLYTKLFGSQVHIKDIDLAESYKEPFVFDGPLSITTDMEFKMPDGSVRRTHAIPTHCDVIVEENRIRVPCSIQFISESVKK